MRINERLESVRRLFAEHAAAKFPEECEKVEIAGVDLEEINGTIVGCVAPFVGRSGYQAVHEPELRRCHEELHAVLPKLAGNAHAYFSRFLTIVNLVLEPAGPEGAITEQTPAERLWRRIQNRSEATVRTRVNLNPVEHQSGSLSCVQSLRSCSVTLIEGKLQR